MIQVLLEVGSSNCFTAGWGNTYDADGKRSSNMGIPDILKYTQVTIRSVEKCRQGSGLINYQQILIPYPQLLVY